MGALTEDERRELAGLEVQLHGCIWLLREDFILSEAEKTALKEERMELKADRIQLLRARVAELLTKADVQHDTNGSYAGRLVSGEEL